MKKNVIISIKPQYVKQILNGTKKFEYRKSIFKQEVNRVYIYESSPHQRIVGYFKYSGTLSGTPHEIWKSTSKFAGIDEASYYKYFEKKECAYAIKIKEVHMFNEAINPKELIEGFVAPQSYMYIEGDII